MAKQQANRQRRKSEHGGVERTAALLDVQLLDVIAPVEALLRNGPEIQREALRVRGVPVASTNVQRAAAAAKIEKIARAMANDHRTVGSVLSMLRKYARQLHLSVRNVVQPAS